jgi:hypothetical protein
MTIDQLIADIRATFPGVTASQRLSCMGIFDQWMIAGEQSALFPDGLSVFCDCFGCIEAGTHDGGVHLAFAAWLENRGFYLEREDAFWFVPTRIPTAEELIEIQRKYTEGAARYAAAMPSVIDDGFPF